jgi:methyl-accepting chemotaxis protein
MFFSKRPIGTWEVVETVIDDALDQFYKIVHDDELSPFMVGRNTQRLKQMQRDHWQATFTSGFNSSYYERLGRIGKAHANVSLPPHFFVRGYGVLMEALMLRLRRKMTNRSDAAQQVF